MKPINIHKHTPVRYRPSIHSFELLTGLGNSRARDLIYPLVTDISRVYKVKGKNFEMKTTYKSLADDFEREFSTKKLGFIENILNRWRHK